MSSILRTKKIGLVDCNSFYVSCERLFNPKIRKKPVVVLSNNDGCIISRSNEAKALGIKMGEPYFKAKDIILKNKVEVFSSNYSLYGDLSRRVMRTLKRFNSEIEVYSIDEAFLDLSNFPDSEVEKVGKEIRETVLQWTGIPTSIGIALLAVLVLFITTGIAAASGAPGGLFYPMLTLGGSIGLIMGSWVEIATGHAPSTYIFAGMGAFVAGCSRTPITAMFLAFALTKNLLIMKPVLISCIASFLIARAFNEESIYERQIQIELED